MALTLSATPAGRIHHSAHGSQSTSLLCGERCRAAGIRPSMGSVGDCVDNALAESFCTTLACELLARHAVCTRPAPRSSPTARGSTIAAGATRRCAICPLRPMRGGTLTTKRSPSDHSSTKAGQLQRLGRRRYPRLRAPADWDKRTPYYGASQFTYDPERDEYHCPHGQRLRRETAKYTEEVVVYRAEAGTCDACPLKAQCTSSAQGRIIHRSFHAEYLERVRAYHATPAYEKAMRKRKVWPEPLFGEAKQWHGMRQFRLRGLPNVNMEGLLIATGQNLKRWLAATGWGRRHGPAGSLLAAPQAFWLSPTPV